MVTAVDETARWHARDVQYWAGSWEQVKGLLPTFTLEEFKAAPDGPPNPYLKAVVRQPMKKMEHAMPVATVSNHYTLAPHEEVARQCFEGMRQAGVDPMPLQCEMGLTELGEWMNLRIYFPEKYRHTAGTDDNLDLRLECFNSVDGSSRLVILLGWYRLICANGMVIGETMAELRDIHNDQLELDPIPELITAGLAKVKTELKRLKKWEKVEVKMDRVEAWVNSDLSKEWGVKAACRVYHICKDGHDVEFEDPFAKGEATEKPTKPGRPVPGSKAPVRSQYDVSQALSWVATRRSNPDERVKWQRGIPGLIHKLGKRR
jgi:hypothetical protein